MNEETGFDITALIDKNEFIENYFNDQLSRLYIITGVGLDTKFQPKTRKEIKVQLTADHRVVADIGVKGSRDLTIYPSHVILKVLL